MKETLHDVVRDAAPSGTARRDVPLVVGARAVSVAGDAAAMIALLLRAHDWGLGPVAVTVLLASFGLPVVLLMAAAGRIADRCDSRRILVVGGLVQAAAAGALAHVDDLLATCVAVVIVQSAHAVLQPTWSALVPRIVGERRVGRVIAVQQGLSAVAGPVGAAAGGMLVGRYGDRAAFLADAGTFALVALAGLLVRTRRGGRREANLPPSAQRGAGVGGRGAGGGAGGGARRRGGLRLLFAEPVLRPVLLALIPLCISLETVNVVEIFLVRDALGVPAEQVGLLTVSIGAGAVVGSAAAGRIERTEMRVRVIFGAFAAMGVLTAASGLAPTYAVLLGLQGACGAANALSNGLLMALVVDRIPDRRRGHANAALNGLARALGTVALLIGGWLGVVWGPRVTFVLCGLVSVLVVLAIGLRAVKRSGWAPIIQFARGRASSDSLADADLGPVGRASRGRVLGRSDLE